MLDVDVDIEIPIILGRPFLAISHALVDICNGKLISWARDEEAFFKLPDALEDPMGLGDPFYFLDITDEIISYCVQGVMAINPLEEYFGELTNDEVVLGQVRPGEHSNGNRHLPRERRMNAKVGHHGW